MDKLSNIDEVKENNLVEGESETPTPTEDSEVAAEPEEEQPEAKVEEVPNSFQKRIDELTWKYKTEREQRLKLNEELKAQRHNPSKPTTEEEQKEKSARDYLAKLVDDRLSSIKSEEEQADKQLQEECDYVQSLYPDFNKTKVLEVMNEFGISNVET